MRNRLLWVALLGVAEVAVCAAILAASWGGLEWARREGLRWRVLSADVVSTEAEETLRYAVDGPATLELSNRVGGIDVTAGDTQEIVVTIERRAWGATEAEAQARLTSLTVDASQRGNALTITVPDTPAEIVNVMGSHRADSIEFTIVVPAETRVTVDTEFGAVSVAGTTGAAEVRTGSGALTVRQVTGRVAAHSNFGEVLVEDITGEEVEAGSGSGRLRLNRVVSAGPVRLETDFGEVVFAEGEAGTLNVEAGSGQVNLSGLVVDGQVSVQTGFGAVTLDGVAAGSYDLHSDSGALTLDGASGSIAASSDFGDVTVANARSATVDLRTGSGRVQFSGGLGAGPHRLRTDFGNVVASLPGGTGLAVDLKTEFGSIRSAFPLTTQGELDEDHWQGDIGGGGPSLTITTGSGSITLEQLP